MKRNAKVALFHGPSRGFEHLELVIDEPSKSEILVEIIGCTICGSDIHTVTGRRSEPTPTVLGHEMVGRVVEMGREAVRVDARGYSLKEGDRITWSLSASCGHCPSCLRNLPQKCSKLMKYGHRMYRDQRDLVGGFAQYCTLQPGTTIVKIADHVSDEIACPANCATATVMAALEAAHLTAGKWNASNSNAGQSVLIVGAGMLGLTAIAVARAWGYAVGCSDIDSDRMQIARKLGAEQIDLSHDGDHENASSREWDTVIEMSGTSQAVEFGMRMTRVGGKFILVGSVFPDRPIALSPEQVVRRCLTITGVHNYRPQHLVEAVEFLETEHASVLHDMVSTWYPLEQVSEAFSETCSSRKHVRVGIRPGSRV